MKDALKPSDKSPASPSAAESASESSSPARETRLPWQRPVYARLAAGQTALDSSPFTPTDATSYGPTLS